MRAEVDNRNPTRREAVLRWQWLISDIALATGAVGFAVLYYLILFA